MRAPLHSSNPNELFEPDVIADPQVLFARLRSETPIAGSPRPACIAWRPGTSSRRRWRRRLEHDHIDAEAASSLRG